jgi:phospholipase C
VATVTKTRARRGSRLAGAVTLAVALALSACGSGPGTPTRTPAPAATSVQPPTAAGAGARGRHIVVVVEENHSFVDIMDAGDAPFISGLRGSSTVLTHYEAITTPSLPNYIAMLSGGTQGITTDCTDCHVDVPNLATQLDQAGLTWKAYMQSMPEPCSDVAEDGAYAKRHNPFMYFDDIRDNERRCRNVVPFDELSADLAAGRLPNFAFITPDVQHDMHDGTVPKADDWAQRLYRELRSSPAWQQDTRVVLTFDEGSDNGPQRVVTTVTGPRVHPGTDPTPYDHYSLLRSIEDAFGLPHLGHAGDGSTRSIPALAEPAGD